MKPEEKFLNEHHSISHFYDDKTEQMVVPASEVEQAMREYVESKKVIDKKLPTLDECFKKYSNLCQFEEGPPEYLLDKDDFKAAMEEYISYYTNADRENLLKYAKVEGKIKKDHQVYFVNEDSILNAPKIELL